MRRRWLIVLVPVVAVVALVAGLGFWLRADPPAAAPKPAAPAFTIPYLTVAAGSAIPLVPPPVPVAGRARWIAGIAAHTDIPTRVLAAYVQAAAVAAPSCHLTWSTLAGIGRVESDHGQHHGDAIDADGVAESPIIGPVLDGSPGVQRIPDTDHGRLDGDPVWDHAVGPMQFLPSRWQSSGVRASGDGKPADPQNIDDAAVTAAHYLCASGDLAVPARWWAATFHYNNSLDYGRAVFSAAQAYAVAGSASPADRPTPRSGH